MLQALFVEVAQGDEFLQGWVCDVSVGELLLVVKVGITVCGYEGIYVGWHIESRSATQMTMVLSEIDVDASKVVIAKVQVRVGNG